MKCAICDVEIEVPEMDLCILCDSQRKYATVLGEGPNVSHLAPSGYGDAFRLAAAIAVVILLAGLAVIL